MEREIANLSLHTLIRECSKDPQEARKHYSYFEMVNRSRIHEVFAYKKFNDDFIDNLTVYNNGEYLIGRIRPCYDEFIAKLIRHIPNRNFKMIRYYGIYAAKNHKY